MTPESVHDAYDRFGTRSNALCGGRSNANRVNLGPGTPSRLWGDTSSTQLARLVPRQATFACLGRSPALRRLLGLVT